MLDFLSRYTFGNPDFGRSDIWHLSLPLRSFFANALQHGTIPVWSKDIGTGFPVFAEGEVGMLNPINLFLYHFFPLVLAFNLTYVVAYLIMFLGCYLYARSIKITKLSAIFFAIIFTFSGISITQTRAIQFIQALSFLPWIFLTIENFIRTENIKWPIIFALALGLQLLTGYPQISVITLIGTGIYFVVRQFPYKSRRKAVIQALHISGAIAISFIIASPQLLATWQLTQLSQKAGGLDVSKLALYPYNPKNFLTFFNPYLWGDPRNGTYPQFSANWGIFWESTGYFGIAPFLLSLLSVVFPVDKKLKKIFWIIAIIAAILLLGKFTPFFFIFQIPPLSFFRVPARFLILFVWSLTILSALTLDIIKKRFPKLAITIILISVIDIFSFAINYLPIIDTKQWLAPPETVRYLKSDPSWFRVYSVVPGDEWNGMALKASWKHIDQYTNFTNALNPDQNIFWGISSVDIYNGIYPRRLDYYSGLIGSGFTISGQDLLVSSSSAKLLSLSGSKYIISPRKLIEPDWSLVASTSGMPTFYIYKNPNVMPHAYLTRNFKVVSSFTDLINQTIDASSSTVIIEKSINIPSDNLTVAGSVKIIQNTDEEVKIDVINPGKDSLLVLSDSYYPTWKAYIDGNLTEIYPININQRALLISQGVHQVRFLNKKLNFFGL